MSIIRAAKNTNYSVISNIILNDERLSWRARGIAAYLLSKPDDWRVNSEHLKKQGTEGRDAVRVALKELEDRGYLRRRKIQLEDGRWATEMTLHETPTPENPSSAPTPEKPTTGKPTTGKPTPENPSSYQVLSTNHPSPSTEDQSPDDGGVGEETAPNCGGEGENSLVADERPDAAGELPAEVIAAWQWPLTAQSRAFLRNAIRGYTAGEVLTAIEIAASQPREIERPAAYVKRVLQRRMSDLVDDAERREPTRRPIPPDDPQPPTRRTKPAIDYSLPIAPALAAEPPTRPTPPPRDVALVVEALAQRLGEPEGAIAAWPIRVDGDVVTVNARSRAGWVSRFQDKLEATVSRYLQRPIELQIVDI